MWAQSWNAAHLLDRRDSSRPYHCPSYKLPALGVIEISPGNLITLDSNAIFRPQCTNAQQGALETGGITSVADIRDPFHASITPQAYATGAATVIAWMLVIMLIITPRTFFVGNASGRSGLMGRRGMISGASGGGSIIGVGSRPWLQKVAALTVAISLTLATADTFKIAGRQYAEGFIDAMELRGQVVAGMEIKVSRVISDIFLWLAQVQTLIRLFPRHKEKVIIKWVGFALILLDIVFSSLNSFGPYENSRRRPAHFDTAIPALSYLFQLSLSMLYAAWVMYYAITKRRYAFYHAMMWNMSVVALLSIIAILTPVVFFITDIANDTIAGWGDYFRWVGAAAASVIVWEWVERIEALEREERKDGILGREIYDGDDMLDTTPSSISRWPSSRKSPLSENEKKGGGGGHGSLTVFTSAHTGRFSDLAHRLGRKMTESPRTEARRKRSIHIPAPAPARQRSNSANRGDRNSRTYTRVQTPPPVPVISSPVSRTDTTSADSTVYTVRYHPISETPPGRRLAPLGDRLAQEESQTQTQSGPQVAVGQPANVDDLEKGGDAGTEPITSRKKWQLQTVPNPFRRKGRTPPQELQRGRVIEPLGVDDVTANIPQRNYTGLALTDRLGTFAAQQGEKFRSKKKDGPQLEANLPVTIIPAQPRGQTWSPDLILQQQAQQDEVHHTTGLQLARVPTAIEEEDSMSSPTQPDQVIENNEIPHLSPSPNPNRSPRIRFAPQSFRAPQRQPSSEYTQQPPVSGVLGTEVRRPPPVEGSLPPPNESTAITDFSVPQQPTCTNHDR
ncbi:PalH-domain-containing protein [Cucurbitaria berberidis CBS 394.84]|uniref:PalH-domain-containing protein n=1 Tax=Cucurbitaria berberidis CBS 394.84 TaxID=1168544 RepID=A0A9P4GLB3_9PLEO|nr:PalH-domain-containing protein [Cucurbitaria berberidis CBS 394.84]KAF1847181.1 PalH-domain-containing protein [Cucurbitaria berberidis CBS 394.84]